MGHSEFHVANLKTDSYYQQERAQYRLSHSRAILRYQTDSAGLARQHYHVVCFVGVREGLCGMFRSRTDPLRRTARTADRGGRHLFATRELISTEVEIGSLNQFSTVE